VPGDVAENVARLSPGSVPPSIRYQRSLADPNSCSALQWVASNLTRQTKEVQTDNHRSLQRNGDRRLHLELSS